MESSSSLRLDNVDKLRDDNFHIWKARIQLILSFKEVDTHLVDDPPDRTAEAFPAWHKADVKAKAIIGLTLSDSHLEQVQHATTAKQMWTLICDIFEKHTLLNKLAARRRFYTAKMKDNEKILAYAARIRQLAATLKSMSVPIEDSEMAMALLNGLPDRYDPLISALDAANIDDDHLTFEFVQSRCLQEEQRHVQRDRDALKSSEAAALVINQSKSQRHNQTLEMCVHCGKHRDSSRCFKKYPHLAPVGHRARAHLDKPANAENKTLVATSSKQSTDDAQHFAICLFSDPSKSSLALHSLTGNAPPCHHWILDSCCTSHVTYKRSAFTSYKLLPKPGTLDLGAGTNTEIIGTGDVTLWLRRNGSTVSCIIRNVLHVPQLRYQLLSVSTMAKRGIRSQFDEHEAALIQRSDLSVLATATQRNGLYTLDVAEPQTRPAPSDPHKALAASLDTWHQRLAHVNAAGIKSMVDRKVVKGITLGNSSTGHVCEGCVLGKAHRAAIPKARSSYSSYPLQLVHSDVLGPVEVPSLGGARYFVSFIDDFSKWATVYTMTHKSKVIDCFKHFKALAEKHTAKRLESLHVHEFHGSGSVRADDASLLQALRSDNGGEYLSNDFRSFLADNGIRHQLTVAYTPQQNGVAERMNRTLLNLVRSMLHHKSMPKHFWAESLSTATYVLNRVTSRSLPPDETPHHRWYGSAPNLSHLRVFGAQCWYVLPKHKVKKLDARTRPALMMGYAAQSKAYKLYDAELRRMVISRDVAFNEQDPTISSEAESSPSFSTSPKQIVEHIVEDPKGGTPDGELDESNEATDALTGTGTEQTADNVNTITVPDAPVRRSSRPSRIPRPWWIARPSTSSPAQDNSDVALLFSKNPTSVALMATDVPNSYAQATSPENIDFWMPGIQKGGDSIRENGTFELVERTPNMHVIPCRYVFRVKPDVGPKVRIVAKGFRQVHGVEYHDTYAPVVSLSVVRLFLCLVNLFDLECDQMDVVTAFLNGDLEEEIYMEVPAGFRDPNKPNLVCRLLKALYGLKQAPKQWHAKIHDYLTNDLGFISCPYEPCLYVRHTDNGIIILILYVDDLLIAGSDTATLDSIKAELMRRFKMKDLGPVNEFL